ncbi:hypothetical protein KJ359_009981 [Pestalotiopsis sp. 9143b]|nr:hypothetical protein KJ359_009981 [Pestalotiopsis sp. 9143b]
MLGIAYGTQYYARYFAAQTTKAVSTITGGGLSTRSTLPRATATSTWAVGLDDQDGLSDVVWKREEKDGHDGYEMFAARYMPMIHQTTPCLEEYGCAKLYQPAICCDAGLFYHKTDFHLSNSGIYCSNNETFPLDGHLTGTICPRGLQHCIHDGGGCCPPHSKCS